MSKEFFYPMRDANDPYHVEKIPISEEVYTALPRYLENAPKDAAVRPMFLSEVAALEM